MPPDLHQHEKRVWAFVDRFRGERYLSPVNVDSEIGLVIAAVERDRRYEPVFVYEPLPEDTRSSTEDLLSNIPEAGPWFSLLRETVARDITLMRIIEERDGRTTTAESSRLYGLPSASVLSEAYRELDRCAESDEGGRVSALEAQEFFRSALQRAGLAEWIVHVENRMNARMSVSAAERMVRVRSAASFRARELPRLVIHELGTHVARAVNGAAQQSSQLERGLPGYLETEEGLATWHEERFAVSSAVSLRRYALRVLAVAFALENSFFDTARALALHCAPREAAEITMRVKRGISNTAAPGVFTKDHIYLSGFLAVRQHLADRPEDHRLLLAGKIGLEHIGLLRELDRDGALAEPTLWPQSFSV